MQNLSKQLQVKITSQEEFEIQPYIEKQASIIKGYVFEEGQTVQDIKEKFEARTEITQFENWWPQIRQIVKRFKPEMIQLDEDELDRIDFSQLNNETKKSIVKQLMEYFNLAETNEEFGPKIYYLLSLCRHLITDVKIIDTIEVQNDIILQ